MPHFKVVRRLLVSQSIITQELARAGQRGYGDGI
jgi:hypothetical protein